VELSSHPLRTRHKLAAALCSLAVLLAPLSAHAAAPHTTHAKAKQEKRLKSWGNNRSGQRGDGTWTDFRTTATTVLGLTSAEVVKIAAGGAGAHNGHGLALLTDKTVQSWGANGSGQLGDGSVFSRNAPGLVANLSTATAIAAGGTHSLALLADQTVVTWGRNNYGQLGNGTNSDSSVEGLTRVIAVGCDHNLALVGRDTVKAWGANGSGQLGDGTTTDSSTPVTTLTALTGVDKIAAPVGGDFSLAN
jgi:alpha-tubulin suppressor-like RCC1 family protein